MKNLGQIGGFVITWDPWEGDVYVGDELATDASGEPEVAYSEARAKEVAQDYIRRVSGG